MKIFASIILLTFVFSFICFSGNFETEVTDNHECIICCILEGCIVTLIDTQNMTFFVAIFFLAFFQKTSYKNLLSYDITPPPKVPF